MEKEQVQLKRTMTSRHMMMLALGGAIGAGLFKGSSSAIDIAGPAVILAYMMGGLILLFIMQGLAEMTVARPGARTFRDLIEPVLGKYPAYFLDWIYWKMWVLNIAAEAIVSAIFIRYWFPQVPVWILVLIISLTVTLINVCSVQMFAETEYWLTSVKIAVIILFMIIGLTMLFVSFGQHTAPGLSNLTEHGGFFPNGTGGLIAAMLVVVYSYGGTEMIGVTLAETKNPEKVIPKAIQSTFVRIIGFYVLPFFIIVSLIPWNQVNNEQVSPFVTVFASIGVPYASDIMNGIILLAILSSMNSGLYASSRVLYTQAMDGRVWKGFSKLSKQQVPVRAILICTSTLYAAVLISLFVGSQTFHYLMGSLSYTVLFIWFIIAVGHLKSRRVKAPGDYRVKFYPITTWFSVIAIIAIFIGVVSTTPIVQTFVTMGIYLIITLSFFIKRERFETSSA
ncbi:amino acid permease [Bacillus sp. NPDC093026]|uniref:amino acid permease n=1 Tax=Bacillus sp. NPDC093026 TaxID=3363948 RepID=UPI00381B44E0